MGELFMLHLTRCPNNPKGHFFFKLTEYTTDALRYNSYEELPGPVQWCSRHEIESILKAYSTNVNIVGISFSLLVVYEGLLKIVDDLFPNVFFLAVTEFCDDWLHYLTSDEQTLSKRIKRLCVNNVRDFSQDAEIIACFENLEELLDYHDSGWFFYLLGKLDKLRRNDNSEFNYDFYSKSCSNQKWLKNMKVEVFIYFQYILLEYLYPVANLTVLGIDFGGRLFSSIPRFFKNFDIHNLRCVMFRNLKYDKEILQLLTPTSTSRILEYSIENWERKDDSKHPIASIFPSSLCSLTVVSQLCYEDLQIIKEECKSLVFFKYSPPTLPTIFDFGRTNELFQNIILSLKNLQFFITELTLDQNFLFSLYSSARTLKFANFNVFVKNFRYLNKNLLKLEGSENMVITQKWSSIYNVNAVFPSMEQRNISGGSISEGLQLTNSWLMMMVE